MLGAPPGSRVVSKCASRRHAVGFTCRRRRRRRDTLDGSWFGNAMAVNDAAAGDPMSVVGSQCGTLPVLVVLSHVTG